MDIKSAFIMYHSPILWYRMVLSSLICNLPLNIFSDDDDSITSPGKLLHCLINFCIQKHVQNLSLFDRFKLILSVLCLRLARKYLGDKLTAQ